MHVMKIEMEVKRVPKRGGRQMVEKVSELLNYSPSRLPAHWLFLNRDNIAP